MFVLILQLLSFALSIWASKEKTKYIDRKIAIETAYWAESNKPLAERDFTILDNLEMELKIMTRALLAEANKPAEGST